MRRRPATGAGAGASLRPSIANSMARARLFGSSPPAFRDGYRQFVRRRRRSQMAKDIGGDAPGRGDPALQSLAADGEQCDLLVQNASASLDGRRPASGQPRRSSPPRRRFAAAKRAAIRSAAASAPPEGRRSPRSRRATERPDRGRRGSRRSVGGHRPIAAANRSTGHPRRRASRAPSREIRRCRRHPFSVWKPRNAPSSRCRSCGDARAPEDRRSPARPVRAHSIRNCSRNSFIRGAPQSMATYSAAHLAADRLDQIEIGAGRARRLRRPAARPRCWSPRPASTASGSACRRRVPGTSCRPFSAC